jgi:5-methylcytosine-specific restriction endonuclease McrA
MSKRQYNGNRDWSWKPDREASAWLDRAETKRRVSKAERKAAKKAKKRRNSIIRQTAAKYAATPSVKFYDSWEWKKLRFEVLKAYGAVCMCCNATERIVVDHIKPRSKFPALELSFDNMQVLCDSCNRGKSNDDYTDFRPLKPEPELSGDELSHMLAITRMN